MYIERKPLKDLPENAIILREDEVVQYYNKFIFETTRSKDIWSLKYGFGVVGFTSFASNYWLISYYRKRCKIVSFTTTILMNLAFVATPAMFATLYHYYECRSRILLHNLCTSCLYGRAAIFQNLFSILYGIGPSAFGCLTYAAIQDTYPVPGFTSIKDTKDSILIWQKFTKRITPGLSILFVINTAVVTFITYSELESKVTLDELMKKQHEKLIAVSAEYEKNQ